MVAQFQRGRLDTLVFQVQAGAAAIELSRAAEVVMYSLPDGWVEFKQFMDRVMGPNQKRPVRNTAILARGTLDRSVIRGLIKKEDWHNTLMDNPEDFLKGLL
jgi:SNF2 family DNA or RNA helicase